MRVIFLIFLLGLTGLQGCATKRHGRALTVSSAERKYLDCQSIEIEIDKNRGFMADVAKSSGQLDGRAVLGILGDLGVGNAMETSDAIESARIREQQLYALAKDKQCSGAALTATATAPLRSANTVSVDAKNGIYSPAQLLDRNGFKSSGFADLNDAQSLPASANCKYLYQTEFLNAPYPRAFALAGKQPNGARTCVGRRGINAAANAIEACTEQANRMKVAPCVMYAVDNRVVWLPLD